MAATLKSRIPLIVEKLDDELRDAVIEVAERIAAGARDRVPVDTGELQRAIHVEAGPEAISVVAGSTKAYYGHMVENGTVHSPPHPFLLPAYEAEVPKLHEIELDL